MFLSGDANAYGNDVILRSQLLSNSGQFTWLDYSHPLPLGILKTFYIYVPMFVSPDYADIHLQIWRPYAIQSLQFTLVWDKRVRIFSGYSPGALYTASVY